MAPHTPIAQDDPADYQAALDYARTHVPPAGRDYIWVVEHANRQLASVQGCIETLDGKAASAINYLGAFSGLATVGAIQQASSSDQPWVALLIVPSVLAAGIGILLAVLALRPREQAFPPSVRKAFDYAEAYDAGEAPARFALATGAAVEHCRALASKKGRLIAGAYTALTVAALLLSAPCVAVGLGY